MEGFLLGEMLRGLPPDTIGIGAVTIALIAIARYCCKK